MSNEDVTNFVTENIANGLEPEDICEELMMRCLAPDCQMAGLGCDNMTVVSDDIIISRWTVDESCIKHLNNLSKLYDGGFVWIKKFRDGLYKQ